ncbi:hypothetical protein Srot_1715 [Segniliparus rotundus DSM 44985]|uniref:EspG family protein n=1 Tax=Segniliparus rotundus (strain ATCC BAA-972 / CDC 1076 / CIP 108378 / DSM 44985 / JCM 13578) TaxID=640132 RepID=D6Z895_SEGRD|nr:hypothetical protein [Segniliparus rotundus]ADG98175.1 hypothetical protein Srot_1715 [Segniliparus rotundus DSM 44985]
MAQPTALHPRRLVLSSDELGHLVQLLDIELPPSWQPGAPEDPAAQKKGLIAQKALLSEGTGAVAVHPSVAANLQVLDHPRAMLATTAHIGSTAVHCLHAVAGVFGASLFRLDGKKLELSFFRSVELGKELLRAVPPEPEHSAQLATLFGDEPPERFVGALPLRALEELGLAVTLRSADPPGVGAALEALALPEEQHRLASRLAEQTDGLLTCDMTGHSGNEPIADRIVWLHAGGAWTGLRPSDGGTGERLVQLEPVQPGSLGVCAASFLASALS